MRIGLRRKGWMVALVEGGGKGGEVGELGLELQRNCE